jgi:hypothetical protein
LRQSFRWEPAVKVIVDAQPLKGHLCWKTYGIAKAIP